MMHPQFMPAPYFTKQNAREMNARSQAARKARAIRDRKSALLLTLVPSIDRPPTELDPYVLARLARVRSQLSRIDELIERERDPNKLERLASASMKLSDQEFALAGRPKPGFLHHKAAEPPKRPAAWRMAGAPTPELAPVPLPDSSPPGQLNQTNPSPEPEAPTALPMPASTPPELDQHPAQPANPAEQAGNLSPATKESLSPTPTVGTG
jgi:hypothetical protein